jgi:hypothetical protein
MILRTRPALSSAARPVSPLPALLLTTVSSRAPCSIRPSMSSLGMPAVPKPPINHGGAIGNPSERLGNGR